MTVHSTQSSATNAFTPAKEAGNKNKQNDEACLNDIAKTPLKKPRLTPHLPPSPQQLKDNSSVSCVSLGNLTSIKNTIPQHFIDQVNTEASGVFSITFTEENLMELKDQWYKEGILEVPMVTGQGSTYASVFRKTANYKLITHATKALLSALFPNIQIVTKNSQLHVAFTFPFLHRDDSQRVISTVLSGPTNNNPASDASEKNTTLYVIAQDESKLMYVSDEENDNYGNEVMGRVLKPDISPEHIGIRYVKDNHLAIFFAHGVDAECLEIDSINPDITKHNGIEPHIPSHSTPCSEKDIADLLTKGRLPRTNQLSKREVLIDDYCMKPKT